MADVVLTVGDAADVLARERRQQAMVERLSALHQSRVQEWSENRRCSDGGHPKESVERFDALFSQRRERVEQGLAAAREKEAGGVKEELDKVMVEIGEMEQLLAASSYYLPAYDVRVSQSCIGRLKDDSGSAMAELLPKTKFRFRNSKDSGNRSSEAALVVPSPRSSSHDDDDDDAGRSSSVVAGIRNLCDEVVVKEAEEMGAGEFVLSDLSRCRVELRGTCSAVFIHRLKDCQVFAGPVRGSVLIEDVERSVFMLASHQIRIHSTKDTDFYLRVRSRPIVEHTERVRFAPYAFRFQGIQHLLDASNLSQETGLWQQVDDFRWLRSLPSPNWSLLPPSQRLPVVQAEHTPTHHAHFT